MRAARLRRSTQIAITRTNGRSIRSAAFVARSLRTELSGPRIAVTAGRSLGRAVRRNRARRRVREAFRLALMSHRDVGGVDVVVSIRPASSTLDFRSLVAEATTLLREAAR